MFKRLIKKAVVMLGVVALLLPSLPFQNIAEAAKTENDTARSMITFFREEGTKIAVDQIARDEIMVYGIFLSNFFVPFQTKVGDMVDTKAKNSIPKRVSKKFFGSEGNSKTVADVNKKLHDPITKGLGFDSGNFGLYNSAKASKPMTGKQFYTKMTNAEKKAEIYNKDGKAVLDLHDEATRAALQVIFGFAPKMMVGKDSGLRKFDAMYMDGLGNIWGSFKGADVQDYVLFMPAALNPVVFSGSPTGGKFPVSNVFVMGGVLKVTKDFLGNAPRATPYYNLNEYFPTTKTGVAQYNRDNAISIFGIQSATDLLGDSDKITGGGSAPGNPIDAVKSLNEEDNGSKIKKKELNIVLSVDAGKTGVTEDFNNKDITKEARERLINYLMKTNVFEVDDLMDDMYYFEVPGTESAFGDKEGSWKENNDLVSGQRMFSKESEEDKKSVEFYNNSYFASPFNRFYDKWKKSNEGGNKASIKWLKSELGSKDEDAVKAVNTFLSDGTFGEAKKGVVRDALDLLNGKGDKVYGVVNPSNTTSKVISDTLYTKWLYNYSIPSSFGMTDKDQNVATMSVAAKKGLIDGVAVNFYNDKGKGTFSGGSHGGDITGAKKDDVKRISNLFHNFYTYRIFSVNSTFANSLTGQASGTKLTTPMSKSKFTTKTAIMDGVNNYPGMYWGYMKNLLGITLEGEELKTTKSFENASLPYMTIDTAGGSFDLSTALGAGGVSASDDKSLEEMQKDIIKKVYGLLSEGSNDLRDSIIKSTQDSWIISTHRSITGSWIGNALSVSAGGGNSEEGGTYAAVVGYINTPSLADLPLTDWVLKDYMYIYLVFLLIVVIALTIMVMTNLRSFRQGILIFLLMSFVLILPQFLVSNVINFTNMAGDKIYSERFNYWAITQHQQTATALNGVRATGSEDDYTIAQSMDGATNVYSEDVGVRLKWMAPKRDDTFDKIFGKNKLSQGLESNLTIFRWLFNSYLNQEEFSDDPLATYLYRPYNSIWKEAKKSYADLSEAPIKKSDVTTIIKDTKGKRLGVPGYRYKLITSSDRKVKFSKTQTKLIDSVGLYSISEDSKEVKENYRYWALNNKEVAKGMFRSKMTDSAGIAGDVNDPYYNAYTLTTESPFYYFYNVMHSRYASVDGDFKSALLRKEVFKADSSNADVNGRLRDFLDLEGLFTYVVPYLQQGNEYVYDWTALNGDKVSTYDFDKGTLTNRKELTKSETKALDNSFKSAESQKKDLRNVWKLYSPWVDQINSLSNVYDQKVSVARKSVFVENTLNPGAYDAVGRPMIFSEADMKAKSYSESDLSDVERRIQATLDGTYKDLMYLTNYYDFDNEVLMTAAAMMATFNFNREFSETNLLGENTTLYPQGFELKNFNYDAFMRLTLLNSTGEPMVGEDDLYERVLDKTSIFTGIGLLICDVLAVIFIPTMKIVVLLLLLFLSIAVSISCVLTPPEKITKVVLKNLGMPSLLYLVASIGFAFVISLFMGEGMTEVVGGRTPELGMSDPTTTLWLMIVVDGIYLFVLWKVIKLLFINFKTHALSAFFSSVALVAGAGQSLVSNTVGRLKSGGASTSEALKSINGGNASKETPQREQSSLKPTGTDGFDGSSDKLNGGGINPASSVDGKGSKDDKFKSEIEEKASKRADSKKGKNPFSPKPSRKKNKNEEEYTRSVNDKLITIKPEGKDNPKVEKDFVESLNQKVESSQKVVKDSVIDARNINRHETINQGNQTRKEVVSRVDSAEAKIKANSARDAFRDSKDK